MDSNLQATSSLGAKPSLTREQIRERATKLADYVGHSGWLGESTLDADETREGTAEVALHITDSRRLANVILGREERRERTAEAAVHQVHPTTERRWNLAPEYIRESAASFAFCFEKAFLQYLNLGLYDLRVRGSLCTWLEEAHDEEATEIYRRFGRRWEFAFNITDSKPELDPSVEVVADELPENLGGPDILWKDLAVLKAYATSLDAAMLAIDVDVLPTIGNALRLIQQANKALSRLQEKLSQLDSDYPILEAAEIFREPSSGINLKTMDSRERDCLDRWAANVWNFIGARIRFKGDENLPPDFSPLGLPSRGETWNYGEEEPGGSGNR